LAPLTAEFAAEFSGAGANASGVGEVRVMPDPLHAFTMAICRADGSSAEEARLVADHLVLANLFGHDSHGVGMMPAYRAANEERLC
jgi:LDH2 family malate/lactate/ureidoglycolate dehydrogenase